MSKKLNLALLNKKKEELSKEELCSTNAGINPNPIPPPGECSCTSKEGNGVDDWEWMGGDCSCSLWTFFGIAWG